MIEFSGEISNKCIEFLQKISSKKAGFTCLIFTIIVGLFLLALAFFWHWMAIFFIIVPIMMTIFASIPRLNAPKKTLSLFIPQKIIIENETLTMVNSSGVEERCFETIKQVIDYKDWYHFEFLFLPKNLYFVCQKNLITQGTIDEFEKLFEGKIIRKF